MQNFHNEVFYVGNIIINGYNISPPLRNLEKVAYIDVLFKKVYDISRIDKDSFDKSIKTSSTFEGINSNQERFIPDIIDYINKLIQRYSFDEFMQELELATNPSDKNKRRHFHIDRVTKPVIPGPFCAMHIAIFPVARV